MIKIVLDTNIVFSAILNSSSRIGKIILQSKNYFQFYSCDYLKIEILKHRNKLQKLTKLDEFELVELEVLITANINFINEGILPKELIKKTLTLLNDIDPNDTPFVALAEHLDAQLWTGDLKLYNGLKSRKFKNIMNTTDILLLIDSLENH